MLADLLDLFFSVLAVQGKKSSSSYGTGRNGVDRDLVPAKLVGENMDQAFDACFGGNVRTVVGEILGEDTAGEGNNAASFGDACCAACVQDQEGSACRFVAMTLSKVSHVAFSNGAREAY